MAYSYKSYSQTKDVMKKYVNATEMKIPRWQFIVMLQKELLMRIHGH